MNTPEQLRAKARHLNVISGREIPQVIVDLHNGARHLESIIGSWRITEPSTRSLQDAATLIEGLRRAVGSMRGGFQDGGPANAA